MKKELFAELVQSIKEGGRILKGAAKPKRSFKYDEPDVCAIRERLGLSQVKFSTLLGISPATLRNWEQRRRKPHGAARVLLRIAAKNPKSVLEAVHG
jgi:putative transcriptional regulator